MALWRSHPWEPRGKGCDSCVDRSILRSREVDPGCEEQLFSVLLGQIFAYFAISKSGPSHPRVTDDHNESDLAEACSGFLKRVMRCKVSRQRSPVGSGERPSSNCSLNLFFESGVCSFFLVLIVDG